MPQSTSLRQQYDFKEGEERMHGHRAHKGSRQRSWQDYQARREACEWMKADGEERRGIYEQLMHDAKIANDKEVLNECVRRINRGEPLQEGDLPGHNDELRLVKIFEACKGMSREAEFRQLRCYWCGERGHGVGGHTCWYANVDPDEGGIMSKSRLDKEEETRERAKEMACGECGGKWKDKDIEEIRRNTFECRISCKKGYHMERASVDRDPNRRRRQQKKGSNNIWEKPK